MDKKKALFIMQNAVQTYKNQYLNKNILFIYKNNVISLKKV